MLLFKKIALGGWETPQLVKGLLGELKATKYSHKKAGHVCSYL